MIGMSRVRILLVALRNSGNYVYPTLSVFFGRDTKNCWSLLSGVNARGTKRSYTRGKCVACRRLHNILD